MANGQPTNSVSSTLDKVTTLPRALHLGRARSQLDSEGEPKPWPDSGPGATVQLANCTYLPGCQAISGPKRVQLSGISRSL